MLPSNCCCGTQAPVNIVGPPGQSTSGANGADGAIVLLGQGPSLDFNTTADQLISGFPAKYIITQIVVFNAFAALGVAAGGIYTGAAKTGSIIIPASTTYSAVTDSAKWIQLNLGVPATTGHDVLTAATLYLTLETPTGSGATATVNVYGYAL